MPFVCSISKSLTSRELYAADRWMNPFWISIMTMTTVGYGDIFPVSYPAKLVGVVCMFYGVYIVSLGVNTMMQFMEMDKSDERSYILINIVQGRTNLLERSVKLMQMAFRFRKIKEKHPGSKIRHLWGFKKLRKQMFMFAEQAKHI